MATIGRPRLLINAVAILATVSVLVLAGFIIYKKRFGPPAESPDVPYTPAVTNHWAADSNMLEQLGPEVKLEGFVVRPPAGYERSAMPKPPPDSTVTVFAGAARADGSRPTFTVLVVRIPRGEQVPTPEEAVNRQLGSVRDLSTRFVQTPADTGFLGEHFSSRARWGGTMKKGGWKTHGFCYATRDGQTAIVFVGQDVEPNHKKTLPIMEAAAQTFRVADRRGDTPVPSSS